MSVRRQKRSRSYAASARPSARARFSRPAGRGAAGPRNLGSGAVGGRGRQNVRSAGFLGIEHKFYDTSLTATTIVSTTNCSGGEVNPSATSLISTVPQGDDASTRDGKQILIESVQITGQIVIPPRDAQSQARTMPTFFIALVQDTQTNAAALDSEAVFVNPSADLGLGTNPLKNLLSGSRFITHKVWKLEAKMASMAEPTVVDDVSISGQSMFFDCYKKLSMRVDFNGGTSASVGNVVNNSLHMICFTDDNEWAAVVLYNARVRFVG